jgi:hypothetical protein
MTRQAAIEVATLTVHIPVQFKRRGGRRLLLVPDGGSSPIAPKPAVDNTMLKLLVKAHRWRRRIECGKAKSITDLAAQENVTDAYIQRVLLLTCLAPDITASILDGRHPRGLSMNHMLKAIPTAWDEQRERWGFPACDSCASKKHPQAVRF